MSFCFCPAKLHIFGQIIKWALCNAHSIKPKGMGARAARFFASLRMTAPAPAFGLYLLVLSVLHLHHLPGLNRPRDLSPNRSQRLADLRSNILHILRLEVPRKCGQNGLAGGGRIRIGHGNSLRSLPVQNVENVVVGAEITLIISIVVSKSTSAHSTRSVTTPESIILSAVRIIAILRKHQARRWVLAEYRSPLSSIILVFSILK